MATTRTPRGTATLVGITAAQGQTCQDCGRELTARMFEVRTAEGHLLILGRKCAAHATGYPTTRIEHEAARAAAAEAEGRRIASLTFAEYLAELAASYGKDHLSNVAAGEDVEWFTARHAEMVARHGTA
jgi:hypothetical protein